MTALKSKDMLDQTVAEFSNDSELYQRWIFRRVEMLKQIQADSKFKGIEPFEKKIFLAIPTMHGSEIKYVQEAIDSGWVTTVGKI